MCRRASAIELALAGAQRAATQITTSSYSNHNEQLLKSSGLNPTCTSHPELQPRDPNPRLWAQNEHLLKAVRFSPHLVPKPLEHDEAGFLRWVALQEEGQRGAAAAVGEAAAGADGVLADGAGRVLMALREEEARLRERRKQLDENVEELVYLAPKQALTSVDREKIGLRSPATRWWERSDRGFTEENLRNNLIMKLAAPQAREPWVHTKLGVAVREVGLASPELDRLEKKRNYQLVGCAQRRGQSWCAQPLDKTLRMPASGIKKQNRYSAAPAMDAEKMDLGDEVRGKDGWLWVVRSCGGKKRWVRNDFESNIKRKPQAASASLAALVHVSLRA